MKQKTSLMLAHDDYAIINDYIKGLFPTAAFDRNNALLLHDELKKAKVVQGYELPADVVRLNSRVSIREKNKDALLEFTVVLPEQADIRQKKVSVFAPLGTALLGFRKGEQVKWQVPAGRKTFTIVEVLNQPLRENN